MFGEASPSRYMRLSKVYLPELFERVSAGEVLEADSNLSISINFTIFSFVTAYNNKTLVAYLYVMLLFVSQTITFYSSNSLYLQIFWFI